MNMCAFGGSILPAALLLALPIGSAWGQAADPSAYRLAAEAARLEDDLAQRIAVRSGADPESTSGRINFRVIIHHLYRQAQRAGDVNVRALLADRADLLCRALPLVDAEIENRDRWRRLWAKASPTERQEKQTLQAVRAKREAVAAIDQLAKKLSSSPIDSPNKLAPLTSTLAGAIGALSDRAGKPLPSAMFPPPSLNPGRTGPAARPDPESLAKQVIKSKLSLGLREKMSEAVQALGEDSKNPAVAVRGVEHLGLLGETFLLLDGAARLSFLSGDSRQYLDTEALTALQLFGHQAMRPTAIRRLRTVARAADILVRLGALPVDEGTKTAIGDRGVEAAKYLKTPIYLNHGRETLTTIEQCVDFAQRLQTVHDKINLKHPFQRPFAEAKKRYRVTMTDMIAAVGKGKLSAANGRLAALRKLDSDLVLLARVAPVVARLKATKPPMSSLIGRNVAPRFTAVAEEGEPKKGKEEAVVYLTRLLAAGDSLADCDRWALKRLSPVLRVKVIGEQTGVVTAAVAKAKRNMAEAYTRPAGPSDAVTQNLRDLADLLRAIHTLAQLQDPSMLDVLNRDRAVELLPTYVDPLLGSLRASVQACAGVLAAGPQALSTDQLSVVRQLRPVADLLATIYAAGRETLGRLPSGLAGIAAQLGAPSGRAQTVDAALRKVSLYLNEAGYDLQAGIDAGPALQLAAKAFGALRWPAPAALR